MIMEAIRAAIAVETIDFGPTDDVVSLHAEQN
jgi:hypothetical protein